MKIKHLIVTLTLTLLLAGAVNANTNVTKKVTQSTTVTCECYGKKETKVCPNDGWCDCSGDAPKVVCY